MPPHRRGNGKADRQHQIGWQECRQRRASEDFAAQNGIVGRLQEDGIARRTGHTHGQGFGFEAGDLGKVVIVDLAFVHFQVPVGRNTGYCGDTTPNDSGEQLLISLQRRKRPERLTGTPTSYPIDL